MFSSKEIRMEEYSQVDSNSDANSTSKNAESPLVDNGLVKVISRLCDWRLEAPIN
jgi:hypothetical protein